jgi:hypothetical protein
MTALLNSLPAKIFTPEKAVFICAELQANDEDWAYKVKHDPKGTGGSIIEIYDENGDFVGHYS